MRNLILLTTAVVLVLVGLHIYLEFDKNRFNEFMENLPTLPSEVPQTLGSTASTVITSVDEAKQMELAEAAIGMKQVSSEAEDAAESFPSTGTSDDESNIAGWDTLGTMAGSEETLLSPEIEVLFSKYHALREIRRYVAAELVPMQLESISIIDEVSEIMADEGTISADGVARANARIRRGKELAPSIFELQDESERLIEESRALLEEYGFSSEEEFYQTHREDYKTWLAAQ